MVRQVLLHEVSAQVQGLNVGRQQALLALVLLSEQFFKDIGVHVQQHRQGANVNDVLEQLALARVGVGRVADLGQRHADRVEILAKT